MKKFGLSKSERIKSRKEFQLVYSSGTTIYSSSQNLKAVFYIDNKSESGWARAGFAVHKKSGTAVWRNRVRRLIKESYRLNKEPLVDKCKSNSKLLLLVFSSNRINQENNKQIFFSNIEPDVLDLINQIENKL